MERHRCKLCYRKFSNGRALGGHMRSHMMNLPIPPKQLPPPPPPPPRPQTPSFATESSTDSPSPRFGSSTSSSSDSEQEQITMNYSTAEPIGSSSLVNTLQDRESETESFKKNPTRKRRSKRIIQKPSLSSTTSTDYHQHYYHFDELHFHNKKAAAAVVKVANPHETELPASSVSDVTSEEDLAFCLMMMSRDKWTIGFESEFENSSTLVRKKYQCETCLRVFRSYQALGGHRASHKKARVCQHEQQQQSRKCVLTKKEEKEEKEEKKVHECPVCLRVFASGQALGGHKRSHVFINGGNIGIQKYSPSSNAPNTNPNNIISFTNNDSLLDLNLPAPLDYEDDDEEISDQVAVSALSDVHF